MKYILIVLVIFSFNYCFSQEPTLIETELWIKEKIEMYGDQNSSLQIFTDYAIEFKNGNLLITEKTTNNYKVLNGGKVTIDLITYNVPIKELMKVGFVKYSNNVFNLRLNIKGQRDLIEVEKGSGVSFKSGILLHLKFDEDKFDLRMSKAFDQLIKLNGGSVASDTF